MDVAIHYPASRVVRDPARDLTQRSLIEDSTGGRMPEGVKTQAPQTTAFAASPFSDQPILDPGSFHDALECPGKAVTACPAPVSQAWKRVRVRILRYRLFGDPVQKVRMKSNHRATPGLALAKAHHTLLSIEGAPAQISNILQPSTTSIGKQNCSGPVTIGGRQKSHHLFGAKHLASGRLASFRIGRDDWIIFDQTPAPGLLEGNTQELSNKLVNRSRSPAFGAQFGNEPANIGFSDCFQTTRLSGVALVTTIFNLVTGKRLLYRAPTVTTEVGP